MENIRKKEPNYFKVQMQIEEEVKKDGTGENTGEKTAERIEKTLQKAENDKEALEENIYYLTRMQHRALQKNLMDYLIMTAAAAYATSENDGKTKKEAEAMLEAFGEEKTKEIKNNVKEIWNKIKDTKKKEEAGESTITGTAWHISEMLNSFSPEETEKATVILARQKGEKTKKLFWEYVKRLTESLSETEDRHTDPRNEGTVRKAREMMENLKKEEREEEEREKEVKEQAERTKGKEITEAREILGKWWVLETQRISAMEEEGEYTFTRSGYGKITLKTKFKDGNNIVTETMTEK